MINHVIRVKISARNSLKYVEQTLRSDSFGISLFRVIGKQLEVISAGEKKTNVNEGRTFLSFRGNTDWEERKLKGYAKR